MGSYDGGWQKGGGGVGIEGGLSPILLLYYYTVLLQKGDGVSPE